MSPRKLPRDEHGRYDGRVREPMPKHLGRWVCAALGRHLWSGWLDDDMKSDRWYGTWRVCNRCGIQQQRRL